MGETIIIILIFGLLIVGLMGFKALVGKGEKALNRAMTSKELAAGEAAAGTQYLITPKQLSYQELLDAIYHDLPYEPGTSGKGIWSTSVYKEGAPGQEWLRIGCGKKFMGFWSLLLGPNEDGHLLFALEEALKADGVVQGTSQLIDAQHRVLQIVQQRDPQAWVQSRTDKVEWQG